MAAVAIADVLVTPEEYASSVSSALFTSGATVLVGLAAAWMLRLRNATLQLLAGLMVLETTFGLSAIAMKLVVPTNLHLQMYWAMCGVYFAAISPVIYRGYGARRSRGRRAGAIALAIGLSLATAVIANLDGAFWMLSAQVRPWLGHKSAASNLDTPAPPLA